MRRVGFVIGVAVLVSAVSLRAADPPSGRLQVQLRGAKEDRTVEGHLIVEAVDGGLLLQLPDQRLELIDPATIVSRKAVDWKTEAETPRDLGSRILRELPPGFDQIDTKHYVI